MPHSDTVEPLYKDHLSEWSYMTGGLSYMTGGLSSEGKYSGDPL